MDPTQECIVTGEIMIQSEAIQQVVGVVALSGLLFRTSVVAVVRCALVIRRRNSTLCYTASDVGRLGSSIRVYYPQVLDEKASAFRPRAAQTCGRS